MAKRKSLDPALGQQLFGLGGALVGAGIGALVGNPALGMRIGRTVGGVAGKVYYAKKSTAERARLQKIRVQTSALGEPIKRLFGTAKIAGNIIWSTDIEPYAVSGGEEYRASFAIGFCKGVASKFLRIWADGRLIYDANSANTGGYASPPAYLGHLKALYLGTETQTADATIVAEEGSGNVPGFRGLVYAVWKNLPLTQFGNKIPTIEAEIAMTASQQFQKDETSVTIATGDQDMFLISSVSPHLFLLTGGIITKKNRNTTGLVSFDVNGKMSVITGSGTAVVNGKFALDEATDQYIGPAVWMCAKDGSSTFLCRHLCASDGFTTNYANKITGEEWEIFVKGNKVFTADKVGAGVRCYDKDTMARLWDKSTNVPNASAEPGNFTYDQFGNLWLISWVNADPASGAGSRFFLSRITEGGNISHYTISDQGRCKRLAYEIIDTRLIAGGGDSGRLLRLTCPSSGSPTLGASLNAVTGENSRAGFLSQYRFRRDQVSFFVSDGTEWFEIDTQTMTEVSSGTWSDWAITGTFGGFAYDPLHRSIWVAHPANDKLYNAKIDRFSATAPTLGSVINSICQQAGLASGEIDTTDAQLASQTVLGYVIGERMSAKEALEPLLQAYHIDARENFTATQIKIQFKYRTAASVLSIAEDKLGAGENEGEEITFLLERQPEQTLPRRLTLRYLSYEREYDEAEVTAQLMLASAPITNEVDIVIPVVLTDAFAKQLADQLLMLLWSEANSVRLSLSWEYCRLEGADPITVTYSGDSYRIRLDAIEHGENRIVEALGVVESTFAYTSVAEADSETVPTPGTVQAPSPTDFFFLELPCLRDTDDVPGPYLAAAPSVGDAGGQNWPGATLYRSQDALSWVPVVALQSSQAIVWGYVQGNALGNFTFNRWDTTNTLTVQMIRGTLVSATEDEVTAYRLKNLIAVGSPDTGWELLQFTNLVDNGLVNGQRNYTISNFLRGRFGSEGKNGTHTSGDLVVVIDFDTPTLFKLETAIQAVTDPFYYKAVTSGIAQDTVSDVGYTDTGLSLQPYAVSEPYGTRHWPNTNDWALNWTRRARIGHDLQDYDNDIPIGEANERYEIDILAGAGGAVLRTLEVGPTYGSTSGVDLEINNFSGWRVVRSVGSFISDGFHVGQLVDIAGFANSVNNQRYRITSLTALTMYVTGPRTPIAETPGSGRTVTARSPAVIYYEADQVTDGGVKSAFYCNIYQLSDRLEQASGTGRGLVKSIQIV